MKTRFYILSFTIIITLFAGCRKYPEDTYFITFRSVTKRLLGDWQINDFKINETSSINLFDTTENQTIVQINESSPNNEVDGDLVKIADVYGIWTYENNQKQLQFQFYEQNNDAYYYFGPFTAGKTSIWDIQKLSIDELWLETNYENKNYKLILNK